MDGFDFLNLVVGLIFIYLIYSIAASTVWEILVSFSNLRGKMLVKWFCINFDRLTFKDPGKKTGLKSSIIEHPLVKGMLRKKDKKPSYVSSDVFTDVLFDLLANPEKTEDGSSPKVSEKIVDINVLRDSLEKTTLLSPGIRRVFLQYVHEASGNLQYVKLKIGKWYEEAQERLIGSYKKNLQLWIFAIAIILVGATNADTINIASYLYRDPSAAEALADKAGLYIRDSAVIAGITRIDTSLIDSVARMEFRQISERLDSDLDRLAQLNSEITRTGVPIGWNAEEPGRFGTLDWIKKVGGLLLTIFAVSLGAPFWFDVLSKLSNLRSSGKKPNTMLEDREMIAEAQTGEK